MFTSPPRPRARCALVANRLRARALVSSGGRSRLLTSVQEQREGSSALPQYGSKLLLGNTISRFWRDYWRDLCQRRFAVGVGRVAASVARTRSCKSVTALWLKR